MTAMLRVLTAMLAAGLLTILVAVFLTETRFRETSLLWFFFGAVAFAYAVMAIGYFMADHQKRAFGRYWIYSIFAFALSAVAAFVIGLREEFTAQESWQLLGSMLMGLASLAATAFLLRAINRATLSSAAARFAPSTLAVGGLLVLSSLFFKIGLSQGITGWTVITRHDRWVTHYASVGQSAFLGGRIPWLQPIFGPVGYAFYLLALATSVAFIVWAISRRVHAGDAGKSASFARLTTLAGLSSVWLLTDIFWGWHYDLSDTPWLATIAAGCWLTSLIFGAVLLIPLAHGNREVWRFRTLLVFQLPLLTFNAVMVPIYLVQDDYFPGLGLAFLMIGLQVQCWTCMYLATIRRTPEVAVFKPFAAAA